MRSSPLTEERGRVHSPGSSAPWGHLPEPPHATRGTCFRAAYLQAESWEAEPWHQVSCEEVA